MKNISKKIVLLILAIASIFTIAICSGCGSSEPEFEGWYERGGGYIKIEKKGEIYDISAYDFLNDENRLKCDDSFSFNAKYVEETNSLNTNEFGSNKKIVYDSKENKYYFYGENTYNIQMRKITKENEIKNLEELEKKLYYR